MPTGVPQLSLIIPTLNEADNLPGLLASLSAQRGIVFEVVICDAGSTDGTADLARKAATSSPFPVRTACCPPGRGAQMNAGAKAARAELLLFLHADSQFQDPRALAVAVGFLAAACGDRPVAGHFGLAFRRSCPAPSLAYAFYEAKTLLSRPDCIRGDQGLLVRNDDFRRLGGFNESLPYLEDVRFVAAFAKQGEWVTLPTLITTSARRFEREGLYPRQVLNAIIINCFTVGWDRFFASLPGLYRRQELTGRLLLHPVLAGIRDLLRREGRGWRLAFWRETGRHVAGNAWQLFFLLDVIAGFRSGSCVEAVWLHRYQRRLEPLFRGRCAGWLAAGLTWCWFRWCLLFRRDR